MGTIKMASPQVNTTKEPEPAWMAHVDKLPPQVQEPLKVWIGDISSKENEAQARSQAAALVLLQLWALSSTPWGGILAGLLCLINPQEVAKQLLTVDGYVRKAFKVLPQPILASPGAMLVIVVFYVLGMISYYLDWIVMFALMAIATHAAASHCVDVWKKEQQRAAKEGDAPEPPVVSPGGSLHK